MLDNKQSELDPSNLRLMLTDSPEQFKTGFELAKNIKVEGSFDRIVISGMGGSALPGDLLSIYLTDLSSKKKARYLPVVLNRTYSLPEESYQNALNFICSYSGNTEETISSFKEALKNELPCIGFSSGGEIEKICKENNIPHVNLPIPFDNFQPRVATGYFFAAWLQILINQRLIPNEVETLLEKAESFKKELPEIEQQAETLAKKIAGKTPIVYASAMYKAVAMIWKIKFNEHAKTPAYWNFFPELNHNEMIGYTNPQAKFFIIMLRDPSDNPKNLNRFIATANLLKKQNIETETIDLVGNDVFTKIFRTLVLGDFVAYHLALTYKQDPTPVAMVEELKAILAKM